MIVKLEDSNEAVKAWTGAVYALNVEIQEMRAQMICAWEDCGKESEQSQVDGAVFREAQKLPDASHNVKQAAELEDKVLGAVKIRSEG